jgi:nucleoside-diphosphate-sugar epimerase
MNKKNILIIGGSGYIGSYLKENLPNPLISIDVEWFNSNNSIKKDYKNLDEKFLSEFDIVVLLAAHSSVKMCQGDFLNSFNNNVVNFLNLLKKIKSINKRIKLIYASSSSVYGMTGDNLIDESFNGFVPHNNYDITKHISDIYAEFSGVEFYGLRFGTVNGYSPIMRNDIMINSMVSSALLNNYIELYVKETLRPILGIKDLFRAVLAIINEDRDLRGHYNLASFNSTSQEIAKKVSEITGVNIVEKEPPINPTNKFESRNYNFAIDCNKFIQNFNFEFEDTIETITNSIINNFDKTILTKRDNPINYGL